MTKKGDLTIAVLGVADTEDQMTYLYDPMLYHAFMLMSQSLEKATYQIDQQGFDTTSPLKFSFTDRLLTFRKHSTEAGIVKRISDNLLPSSDGVIVNLAKHGQNVEYLGSNRYLPSLLREIIHTVYQSGRPTVFAVEFSPSLELSLILRIPKTVPIIAYNYDQPISVQEILAQVIGEIDKNS